MKSAFFKFAAGVSACLLLASCGSTAKFTYPDRMDALVEVSRSPLFSQRVAVLPFEDYRGDDNQVSTMSLYYVPGAPFGYSECERPESASRFTTIDSFYFNPTEDLAKAAALSLRRSNLFKDAYFTYGGDMGSSDLILEGKVVSTYYKGRLFSYCVSIYSIYLWALGAPNGTSLNRLALRLSLKTKSGKVLWEGSFDKEDYVTQWLYARRNQDVKFYAPLMRQGMNEAIDSMASQLRANPALLQAP